MELLPEDVAIDIFLRLPAKSIGRIRCVSKPLNRLLSQPHFIKTHLNRTKHLPKQEETLIIVSYYSDYIYSSQLRVAHQLFDEMSTFATNHSLDDQRLLDTKVKNVACCDGLILVWDYANKLLLFNHTTKEVLELITPSYAHDSGANYFTNGIGYDSFTDDYKVVTVSYCNVYRGYDINDNVANYDEMFVDVYSVKNGTWKRVGNCTHYYALNSFDSGVFVDSYIHWRATRISDNLSVIMAFDLKEESFHEIVFPSWIGSETYVGSSIVSVGGCLSIYPDIASVFIEGLNPVEIWIMKEYGSMESWTNYEISSGGTLHYSTRCLVGEHQVVLEKHDGLGCLVERGISKLVLYDLNERIFKDVVVHGIADDFFVGGTSMESLVSPYPHGSIGAVRRRNLRVASQTNLVPKEPSRSSLHRLISVMALDNSAVYVCILVLGLLVAIVKWLLDVV